MSDPERRPLLPGRSDALWWRQGFRTLTGMSQIRDGRHDGAEDIGREIIRMDPFTPPSLQGKNS